MEKSIDMLGLIGGGLGLASSMFGGIKAAKERKRQDRIIREAKQRNEDFFNSEYYQNYMDRSDVQAAMKRVRDTMRKSNRTAAASAAVTGATPEAVVAQKQANNEIIADAASGIQANADAYKNNVKSLYLNQQNALDQARLGQSAMSERGYAGMAGGALQTAGGLLGNSKLAGKMVDRLGSVWNK